MAKIEMNQIRSALRKARGGQELGLNGRGRGRGRGLDSVDAKSMPMGQIGEGAQWKAKARLGTSVADGGDSSESWIDFLARGPTARGDSAGASGVKHPAVVPYHRAVRFFESNPGLLKMLRIQASSAAVIQDCSIAVVRRIPFSEVVGEKISLATFLDSASNQTDIVTVPINCEIDGSTFVRLYFTPGGVGDADREITLTFQFAAQAERRADLGV